ncbi:hypothetical protein SERLADRAFT_403844 [Serpula lacrymans var. lacrymans S7.9]|uniref:Uncharacterized protein n=1 Tax=Serpula lacrymans var. lacrymans (strain S7.9) TaxID=578457 RepID=F8PDZ1_SERL9|nr:uncharacterized protein SERLADRAFT_403844 [Serpula lacrymans var. lacrymans S7.9]EGO18588.1 hypothetical protein SERLADRAFT_403844 [Serpula lacrymans var. lacrymans S7.9]
MGDKGERHGHAQVLVPLTLLKSSSKVSHSESSSVPSMASNDNSGSLSGYSSV